MNTLLHALFPFLLLALLSACSARTDGLLVDRLDVETIAKPIVRNLTTGEEVRAWLYADSALIGFGGIYAFYTPNEFDSLFAVSENALIKKGKLLYNDFERLVIQTSPPEEDLRLEQSEDYGSTYSIKVEKDNFEQREETGILIRGTHSFDAAAFAGIDIGWVFSSYNAITGDELFASATKVYSVVKNGFTGEVEMSLIAELPIEYRPVDAAFFNALSGWLLTRAAGKDYVFTTGDSGVTWEGPFEISGNSDAMEKIVLYDPQTLYLYSSTQTAIYGSHDGGMTWLRTEPYLANLSHYGVSDLYAVNDQVAYAALNSTADDIAIIGNVFRTTNGGDTWTQANTQPMYAEYIDCLDENICIATSKNVVQITRDGGVTWKVLVYPL